MHRLAQVLLMFCCGLAAAANPPVVWFTSHHGLYRVDGVTNEALQPVSLDVDGPLAMDGQGAVWATADGYLHKITSDGTVQVRTRLPALGLSRQPALAINAQDGSLWAADQRAVVLLDTAGQGVGRFSQSIHDLRQILAGSGRSVWLLGGNRLVRYSATGELLASIDLRHGRHGETKHFVVDELGGVAWLAGEKKLIRLELAGGNRILNTLSLPDKAEGLALQPKNGTVWVLGEDRLLAYDANGVAIHDLRLRGLAIRGGHALAFDPVADSLWIAHAGGLTRLSTVGEPMATVSTPRQAQDVAAAPFALVPRLSLLQPADGLVTGNPLPSLILQYGALCNGQPCGLPPDNLPVYSLTAKLGGQAIGSLFVQDQASGRATYKPATRLPEGLNTLTAQAWDSLGNGSNIVTGAFTIDTSPPAMPSASLISAGALGANGVTITGTAGSAEPGARVRITNLRTGDTVEVLADADGAFSAQINAAAGDQFRVTALDSAANESPPVQLALPNGEPLPPDPATVASPINPTVPTQLAASTAFLYTGPNAIQTGVAAGTIETRRAAVLRGKVESRDGTPLGGVMVSILDHPEFGATKSRADGMFDLAVNGGGHLTLNYAKTGYLPAQRTVRVPWQDYAVVDDVALVTLDSRATLLDLSAAVPMQVARGSVVADQDGSRQATLLFPQGTTATMVLPDGSTQALSSITVRATEFTVGPNGPKAMPGLLPPASGYTYAADYSVDEAIAVDATSVRFNQPIYQYVENFLNFPVGGIVPAGYYDRQKAAWIPSDNGVVVKVMAIADGMATLDTDGDGQADDAARLAVLKVSDAELAQLAALYAPGTSLWRVPITHFTPWDYNWPFGPPPGAEPPKEPNPGDPPVDDPDCQNGSIIECQNQSLGESVAVAGTPFRLHYKSSHMPGRDTRTVPIRLSGATLPPGVKRIELEVAVAGRRFRQSFAAAPNLASSFAWDGLDAYGRAVLGTQIASVLVGFVYDSVYQEPSLFARSFGRFGVGTPVSASRARQEITLWRNDEVRLGAWQEPSHGLGGWGLTVLQRYDAGAKTLYLGNGHTRSARSLNASISTVAGNGSWSFSGDGGPATLAGLYGPIGLAMDTHGNLFVADFYNNRVRKIGIDGTIATVAGNGAYGGYGATRDGVAATTTALGHPSAVAVDAKGNLYITDGDNVRIRKVAPDGIISTVAGLGYPRIGFSGDGGPAVNAVFDGPEGLAVDAEGSLYIADVNNSRVRKVTPDGIIVTVAGNGTQGYSGDGGPAASALLNRPSGVAVDARGNLYIADRGNSRIRKVAINGTITTVAGTGIRGNSGDGGPATAANLGFVIGLVVDGLGNLYVADSNHVIRKISPDGIINTIAGNGYYGYSGDGGPAVAASFRYPDGLAVDPLGNLYITDDGNNRVRKVAMPFPGAETGDIVIASEEGSQLYHFDPMGRHLRTLSALTGAELFRFTYDAAGYVIAISDGDGNLTRIERDEAGRPLAIAAPGGQRTLLSIGADGYLASITNPAGEATSMSYGPGGLLATFTTPRGYGSRMRYDAVGRLVEDRDAAGGSWTLSRTGDASDYEVVMTTALSRDHRYRVERLSTGDVRRTVTQPDGSVATTLQETDGTTRHVAADGTLTTTVAGPDPRFGMQAPVITATTVKTPGGLTQAVAASRTATLADPADPLSLLIQTDTVSVNGKAFTSVFDAIARRRTTTTPAGRQSVADLDAQGRPLRIEMAGLLPVTYTYDSRGRITAVTQGSGAQARATTYAYDAQGYLETITDPLGRVTR